MLISIALNIPSVQRALGQYAAKYLSGELGVPVSVANLRVKFFSTVVLDGVFIGDFSGDTLFYAGEIDLGIKHTGIFSGQVKVGEIALRQMEFNYRETSATESNLDFLINYFVGESVEYVDVDTASSVSSTFIDIDLLELDRCRFTYRVFDVQPYDGSINFDSLNVSNLSGQFSDISIKGDSIHAIISNLRLQEGSGFEIANLSGDFAMSPQRVSLGYMEIITGASQLHGSITLKQSGWSAWSQLYSDIEWDAVFDSSSFNLSELKYFAANFEETDLQIGLDGRITGSIDDLKSKAIILNIGSRTVIQGSVAIQGLPNIQSSFIDGQIKQLSTDYGDIEQIRAGIFSGDGQAFIPSEMKRAGSLFFNGSFTGFPTDFVAYGKLYSEIGQLDLDLNFERDTLDRVTYSGGIAAKAFDIGKLLDQPDLGKVTLKTSLKAETNKGDTEAKLAGLIASLDYLGYSYTNLNVDGNVTKKGYSGRLISNDPNFNLIFDGLIDFSGKRPILNFDADIFNLNLSQLNLVKTIEEFSISTKLSLDGEGNNLDNIYGSARANDTYLCFGDSVIFIDNLYLFAAGDQQNRRLSFESSIMDFTATGSFSAENLLDGFQQIGHDILPTYFELPGAYAGSNISFNMNYKKENGISAFLIPGLRIAANTSVYGSVNSFSNTASFALQSPGLGYAGAFVQGLRMDLSVVGNRLNLKTFADSASYGGVQFEHFDLAVNAYNDSLNFDTDWYNTDGSFKGHIKGLTTFESADTLEVGLFEMHLSSYNNDWDLSDTALLTMAPKYTEIQTFELRSATQQIFINGLISENPTDELQAEIRNLDLGKLSAIPGLMPADVDGTVNLKANLSDFYGHRIFRGQGRLDSLVYGTQKIGDIAVSANFDPSTELVDLDAEWFNTGQKIFDFVGSYALVGEEPLRGKILLKRFDLGFINELGLPEVSNFSGTADGEIRVEGKLEEPRLEGFIRLDQARFKVDYLNTYFTFSDEIRVERDFVGIDYKPIFDDEGHKGFIVASAFHSNYGKWNYDLSVDVNNFYLLNTNRNLNELYFGEAYATGTLQMSGYDDVLQINIEAITEKGTSLKLPLDGTSEQTLENFVYFVDKSSADSLERQANLDGVELTMNIEATNDAEIQLIFNEQSGEIIRAQGSGILTLETTPSGEFLMFGRYIIDEGDYLFTLKSLINKQFDIRSGSSIGWYGDPYQADINISAVYQLRAPLYPIMVENQDRYRSREDVNVVLGLNEKLLNPDINFTIELPQATAVERNQLSSVVSTTQQLNQQVFSLLILNRFLPSTQNEGNSESAAGVQNFGAATTSDFVSTQISSWLSEISDQFDVGVNYRPGDQISNQEVALALSTQLFNERLAVSGSFGVTSATETQYTQGQSGILGDFKVEYLLTEEGKIRLKVFNETNPYQVFSTPGSLYTQGVGLVYQEDFDTLDEFFQEISRLFKKDKVKGSGANL